VILTDREIKLSIVKGLIVIDPAPDEKAFSSTAVDLTLDEYVTEFKDGSGAIEQIVDPSHKDFQPEKTLELISNKITIPADGYLLRPHFLVLAWTKEYISLISHNRVAARVEGKSSLARLGLGVHVTAPTIHAGFDGHIRLEMMNHGKLPIRLRTGMRICQLIFEQTLGTPEKGYQGQFSGQGGA
jgi:dCTP deaminase